ncbi:MAG: PQQ-binding-like beta-propeller repeat protein [Planctomycetota bacterium]
MPTYEARFIPSTDSGTVAMSCSLSPSLSVSRLIVLPLISIGFCLAGCGDKSNETTGRASGENPVSSVGDTGSANSVGYQVQDLELELDDIEARPVNQLAGPDWPQILGPGRNGVATGETLLNEWADNGPELLWARAVGEGNAGVVVVAGNVIVFHRHNKFLICEALDAATGEPFWRTKIDAGRRNALMDGDAGPKATPLVDDGRIFLFDHEGWLICLNLSDGSEQWMRNVRDDFAAPPGYFGSGASPAMIDGKLIVTVGGENSAVVAFDPETGDEIWQAFDDRASYASPVQAEFNGRTVIVALSRTNLLGLSPEDGEVLFQTGFGRAGATARGATPVVFDQHIFLNEAYGVGAKLIDISGEEISVTWENDDSFSSQYSTPCIYEGHLYGTAGREDHGNGSLRCVEALTGEIKWNMDGVPVGHTVMAGNLVILFGHQGKLTLFEATPDSFKQLGSARIFERGISRAIPALSNGRLFVRSNARAGTGVLKCFKVGETN